MELEGHLRCRRTALTTTTTTTTTTDRSSMTCHNLGKAGNLRACAPWLSKGDEENAASLQDRRKLKDRDDVGQMQDTVQSKTVTYLVPPSTT